ncbi:hypothetical protein Q9L58_000541 [Maublancomyces gigas]|uniref:Uncharacterized protein n=1 Tax=Discina gigas TaxID=1032678 RepID=A0ABR3GWE7_9PEZI
MDYASTFLNGIGVTKWSIETYLNAYKHLLVIDFDKLCDSWIRALTKVAEDPSVSHRKRATATKLLNRYKVDCEDQRTARAIRDAALVADVTPSASVVNGNSLVGNVFSNSHVSINSSPAPPPPEQVSKKRKRETKRPAAAPRFLKHFAESFNAMDNDRKWHLPSGVCVENYLYDHYKRAPKECAAHSWVIDIEDPSLRDCFDDPDDWNAICSEISPLPDLDSKFVDSMMRFVTPQFESANELQNYLDITAPFQPEELSSLTYAERSGRRWVDRAIRCWSGLCQTPAVFESNNREFWYISNFWGPVFDQCMLTVKGSYMSRGESKSLCTSDRKNSPPQPPGKRIRVGHLYDGILQFNGHEVGAVEHARQFTSKNGKKWVADTHKVVKVLHDMLYQLQLHAGEDSPTNLRRLQVVGMVAAGWNCKLLRMVYAKGYMCLLCGDDVRKIPASIDKISDLIMLLSVLWRFRGALDCCDTVINPAKTLTPQQLAEQLMNPSGPTSTRPKSAPIIPRSIETDDGIADDTDGTNDDTDGTDDETDGETDEE